MSQKTNKIIVLITFIVFIGVIFYLVNLQKKLSQKQIPPSPVLDLSTYEGKVNLLLKECNLPEGFLMNICRYSPLQKSFPINENKEIERNNQKTTIPVVHFGDLDIFKINLKTLFTNPKYQEISNKLPDKFQLCFEINPLLEKISVYPTETLLIHSPSTYCTKFLDKTNLPEISFAGYIPYPSKQNQEITISLYLVPKDLNLTNLASLNDNFYKLTPLVNIVPAIIEK